jgi:hypothetical protein
MPRKLHRGIVQRGEHQGEWKGYISWPGLRQHLQNSQALVMCELVKLTAVIQKLSLDRLSLFRQSVTSRRKA